MADHAARLAHSTRPRPARRRAARLAAAGITVATAVSGLTVPASAVTAPAETGAADVSRAHPAALAEHLTGAGTVHATAQATYTSAKERLRLRRAIRSLPVARERDRGYDRDKFGDWIDADQDCRDTRNEVLAAESRARVRGGCDITRGRWLSYYDQQVWRDPSDVDIDHMVPLAEAWGSGARRWTARTRVRYANDLGDRRSLVAVTDNVNQSKGDRDPAEWLPEHQQCRYVAEFTVVKQRWSLKVNRAERRALLDVAADCDNVVLRWEKARVRTRSGGGGGGGGTDPRFDTCTEAKAHGYGPYYRGVDDEYWWYDDADDDGVVCE